MLRQNIGVWNEALRVCVSGREEVSEIYGPTFASWPGTTPNRTKRYTSAIIAQISFCGIYQCRQHITIEVTVVDQDSHQPDVVLSTMKSPVFVNEDHSMRLGQTGGQQFSCMSACNVQSDTA